MRKKTHLSEVVSAAVSRELFELLDRDRIRCRTSMSDIVRRALRQVYGFPNTTEHQFKGTKEDAERLRQLGFEIQTYQD